MPPVSGALRWTHNLYERIKTPQQNFKALQHPLVFKIILIYTIFINIKTGIN